LFGNFQTKSDSLLNIITNIQVESPMSKVILDLESFKALSSDTRVDILKALDGKKMGLNDLCKQTQLTKATLHEHLNKLVQAGLIKKNQRDGHKWVYYKLSWKGSSLLHPENTRVMLLFTTTIIALSAAITGFFLHLQQIIPADTRNEGMLLAENDNLSKSPLLFEGGSELITQNQLFLGIGILCAIIFVTLLTISLWRYKKNKEKKL